MAKRKSGSGGIALTLIAAAATAVAAVPRQVWIFGGIALAVALILYLLAKSRAVDRPANDEPTAVIEPMWRTPPTAPRSPSPAQSVARPHKEAEPVFEQVRPFTASDMQPFVQSSPTRASYESDGYPIPPAPRTLGSGKWLSRGKEVEVAGFTLPGGMLYVGTSLSTPQVGNDPCLIDPKKPVSGPGDFTERQTQYWPSYGTITPSARKAYLEWLADGRRHPDADVGYVFLFFFGLERRVLIDAAESDEAKKDLPAIAAELRELMHVYGGKSASLRGYASELLTVVELAHPPSKLYEQPLPILTAGYELPLYLRLALGQAAVDHAPVPAALACAWLRLAPDTALRTPAVRCVDEFDKLFAKRYEEQFGAGLVLSPNKTKLKFVYRPASAGFRGYQEIKLSFGDIPDVSVLTAPMKKLVLIVEAVTKELDAYSRYVGKNPESKFALEALLQLPATLWPASAQRVLEDLKSRMGSGMVTLSFQELTSNLEAKGLLTKEKVTGLARALESMNIAMEPDVLGGAKAPKPDDKVVLFNVPAGEQVSRSTPAYQAAVLTLELASTVAMADGEFGIAELGYLRQQVQSWTQVTPSHQRRLMARLRLLTSTSVSLPALKSRLEPLGSAAKETIAAFMATVAQADGTITTAEVKALEKIYKALGVESKKAYGAVLSAPPAKSRVPTALTLPAEPRFKLDTARIAALQRESEKVSSLLANIFTEEEPALVPVEPTAEANTAAPPSGLLGLDERHTTFARLLLSRPQWSRAELLDVSADLELMLDGALEMLNEASFDMLDMEFTDGDDPVRINNEVLEKVQA